MILRAPVFLPAGFPPFQRRIPMAYQEVLVHLDESRNCPARLTAAVTLAQALGARLTGLSIMPSPDLLLKTSVSVTAESIAAERQAATDKADQQQELFKQAVESV